MKNKLIHGMLVMLFALFVCTASAVAEDTVTRELPDNADAGATITVNLTVDVETGATNYIIDEIVPSGWNVTSATGGGDYNAQAGHIMWAITSGATDIVYSYTVDVPADASGTYTFGDSSYYVFEGMSATAPILGDTDVTVGGVSTPDTTPPNTAGHDPAADATGVPIDMSITVHVLDDGSGVNMSTIVMTVNGTVVTPDITGTTADYTIAYTPPNDFGYDQLVNVTIDAADLNEAPNVMTTDAYSFTTAGAPTYGVTISQPSNDTTVEGVNATYLLTVTNTGNVADTYTLDVTNIDGATTAALNMTTIALAAAGESGDSGVVALDVTNTTTGTFNVTVNVTSLNATNTTGNIMTTVEVRTYGVTISQPDNQTTYEGVNATYLLTVENTGNVADTYTLAVTNIDGATTAALNMPTIELDAGKSGVVALDVTNTTAGTFNVTVNATSQTDADANYTTSCIVTTVEVKAVDTGRSSGGSSSGTYPPGWGEEAPAPAATSAPEEAASPAPTKAPTVAPTKAPTKAPTVAPTETTTTEMKTEGTPGFGAVLTVFAIAGLLVAAYMVMRRRE